MELSRYGAAANHGTKTRKMEMSVKGRQSDNTLQFYSKSKVSDFNTSSTYYYHMNYKIDEIKGMIKFLSLQCVDLDDDVIMSMKDIVPNLVKLTNVISNR